MSNGKVWLVGAGPGDVGLLTVKARDMIQNADTIVYDSLVGDAVLALIPAEAELIDVGKRAANHTMAQEDINRVLLDEAQRGRRVVRLKGGDPFLFGRGGEELELLLEHNINFEIVPGITSALSVPAYAGIPVTHRDFCSSVHIITGQAKRGARPEIDFDSLVKLNGTLVFLMGVGSLEYICGGLLKAGMNPAAAAAILENGTSAHQRSVVSTLAHLADDALKADIAAPAVILIGQVASLAGKFHWAQDRPLGCARIIVTRPAHLASKLAQKLRSLGAEVIELPSIQTQVCPPGALENAINNISDYKWIAFTSHAGADIFFDTLIDMKVDIRTLSGIKFAAVGDATAESVRKRGVTLDLIAEAHTAEALAKGLIKAAAQGEKVLIPRAKIGTRDLTDLLSAAQIAYDDIAVYDTLYREHPVLRTPKLLAGGIDYVAFTSASCVSGFVNTSENADLSAVKAVCIGESTAKRARQFGMQVFVSERISIEGIADKIVELETKKRGGDGTCKQTQKIEEQ